VLAGAAGELDVSVSFVGPAIVQIDEGDPIVFLAGVHVGCFELFGSERVRTIRDLKGKSVAIPELGPARHLEVDRRLRPRAPTGGAGARRQGLRASV
jgi:ABC-type nitrate/sulfonate/bicarbonate transport system substrate-binding protein